MKNLYTTFFAVLLTASVLAQAPEKMSYQAVIRNSSEVLVASSPVGMQISILQGSVEGEAVYVETQAATTNANGLVTIEIGGGTPVTGTFEGIDWSAGPYFIKTETDPDGGTSYSITGTNQLLSVPYSLYANYAMTSIDAVKFDNATQSVIGNNSPLINTGTRNVLIGKSSGYNNTSGTNNVFIGSESGFTNSIGTNNVAIGKNALSENDEGSGNIAIGSYALEKNKVTTPGSLGSHGFENVAIGSEALRNAISFDNVAVGTHALRVITDGTANTALGIHTMSKMLSGGGNTALGAAAMINSVSGNNNIAIGRDAGNEIDGSSNVFIGNESGRINHGSSNIFIGFLSGYGNTWQNVSNRLIIHNNFDGPETPLIYGEFDNSLVRINGSLTATNGINANDKIISNVATPISNTDASNKAYVDALKQRLQDLEDIVFTQLPLPTGGLVAFYPFNGNANDESGNSNNGTINGVATMINDRNRKSNSAYSFSNPISGATNCINATFGTPLNTSVSEGLTISGWCTLQSLTQISTLISLWDAANQYSYSLVYIGESTNQFVGSNGEEGNAVPIMAINGLNTPQINTWYHILLSCNFSDNRSKFYVNGVLQGESSNTLNRITISNIKIGSYWNNNGYWYANGNLDDIRVYDRAITDVEIKQLYNEGGYPNTLVTDIDGNSYNSVKIGTQTWMAENLKTMKYNDGTEIPNITDDGAWAGLTTGAYSDYSNAPANSTTYGRLYNWYAIDNNASTKMASNGGKNVCPTGWHVPSDAEWTTLTTYLTNNGYGYGGSGDDIGKSMASTSGWTTDPTAGNVGNDQASNNSSGFTALPSGYRNYDGSYYYFGGLGIWWSSTEYSTANAYDRDLGYGYANVGRTYYEKRNGFSVRCIKD